MLASFLLLFLFMFIYFTSSIKLDVLYLEKQVIFSPELQL
jgi:hypothetical protein